MAALGLETRLQLQLMLQRLPMPRLPLLLP